MKITTDTTEEKHAHKEKHAQRPGLIPALAQLVRENDRNRRAALAATVQANIDHANHGKTVAVVEFNRAAQRLETLLTALIDNGVTSLTLLSGDEVTLSDLALDNETDDQTTVPEGAEGQDR